MVAPTIGKLSSLVQLETLIFNLSARFINLRPDQVGKEIEKATRELREFLEVDRFWLLKAYSAHKAGFADHGS